MYNCENRNGAPCATEAPCYKRDGWGGPLLLFRNSPLAGEVSFQLARSRSDKASLSRNICSDYHGREETIDIAKDGEFIFDDLILCPQLPAKEKAAAQAGAPPIDSAPLAAVGEGRLLLRALHRHCQECVATSSSTTRSRVFRCRPRRTHRPALTEAA